jgi:hypothetical protein
MNTKHLPTILRLVSIILVVTFLLISPLRARAQSAPPIPRLEHVNGQYHFLVDGKPFLILGGQAHNSSASNPDDIKPAMDSMVAIHANTIEVPIYWELIEPQPGKFDFHLIDSMIETARSHRLRLVLLWFASWKNGEMTYTPDWLKRDRNQYRRVVGARGEELYILSPLCEAARQADERAFAAVMQHIRSVDEANRTVIMMQVENETGLLGTDRDYAEEATRAFRAAAPGELMTYLDQHRNSLMPALQAAWADSHYRKTGTWTEVFGELAPEAFSAWYVARYVDAVTAAGKQAYPLPMYVNNWLINPGNERAGRWPSGGPTVHVLDIWKAAAPHIDLLAPDIYLPKYGETAAAFTRPDNPLFVPEVMPMSLWAPNVFLTLATFNGIGFSPFGIDDWVKDGKVAEDAVEFEDSYRALAPLLPMIARTQYTGKLHAIAQDVDPAQAIRLGPHGKLAAVVEFPKMYELKGPHGRGMIIELGPDDFVFVGANFRVDLRELEGPPRSAMFLSLEEGTFDGERWVTTRRLNGDEFHLEFPEKAKTLRVRLLE